MNADDMKRLLEQSLHEGDMDRAPGPDETSIAGRVRGARRRRAAASAVAGVASIALAAAVVWQVGGFTNDPNPPATPTTDPTSELTADPTDRPSDDPTDDPTDEPTGGEQTDPADWSDAIFPECGDTFDGLPERTSQLVVTQGPSETLAAAGSFMTTVENAGSTDIQGDVALFQSVVVDASGAVVATVNPADDVFRGAEGGFHMAIAGSEEMPFRVNGSYECAGDMAPLGSGEYEVYVLLTVGQAGTTDPDALEQAQGGPFPMVIDESLEQQPVAFTPPDGAPTWAAQCGEAWSAPQIDTGFELELLNDIRSPRAASDDIDGGSQLTVSQQVQGSIYDDVVLLQDGQVVSMPLAGDAQSEYYLSAGSQVPLSFSSSLLDCDGTTLPPGQYQAVVVTLLGQWTGAEGEGVSTYVVAATDPVDLVLN